METVKRATAAQRMRPLMAFDRKPFRDKLRDILGGAITHYFMGELAELNGQTKWVHHWNTEVDRLVNMDTVRVLVTPIKGNWDKMRALQQSLQEVQGAEGGYRKIAANYVAKVYKLKRIKQDLVAEVEKEFYQMVQ